MVNARKWLNEKISEDQRVQATCLYIYGKCLIGELNLNSFVNLKELCISSKSNQKLTSLKIDKCNKLIALTISYTNLERLISTIRNVKSTDIDDLKLKTKKIEEEYLEYQLAAIKDKYSWLEVLLEA
ncbi:14895_t:CDS:2 [Cetraspora pellucida]|uniref:14895_t:CDS:1 n=1 Tax=Cetraspora pellucida TaxID=1433469 RepID=A0A9N9F516_9GLOM|nr:14895_t:CDS:2 [Cetraspora pellucida]